MRIAQPVMQKLQADIKSRYANNLAAENVLIIGDREVNQGTVSFKNLAADGVQKEISRDAATIAEHIRAYREN